MKKNMNLKHKVGQGVTLQHFMDTMQVRVMKLSNIPNTKELFLDTYDNFIWKDESDRNFFKAINGDFTCLILCTDWCPDVIWNVPVLFRVMEQANIPTEVLLMEEHLETMDLFLTDGGRAQPIAVILDKDGEVLGQWGARPNYIQAVMDAFKQSHPDKEAPNYQEEMGKIYQQIGEIYHEGTRYQAVMLQELKELFTTINSKLFVKED